MKKLVLAFLGLAFAFAISSCGDREGSQEVKECGKKCNQTQAENGDHYDSRGRERISCQDRRW